MTGFLAELGRKLAERWFTLLVLPGLAYLLVAAAVVRLGRSGRHDWRALWDGFTALTEGDPGQQDSVVARAVLLILAAVPVSAAVGALAQALAGPVERALCGPWPHPFTALSARLTARRERAWTAEDTSYRSQRALAEAAARRQLTSTQAARHAERQTARTQATGTPPAARSATTPDPAHPTAGPDATHATVPDPARSGAASSVDPDVAEGAGSVAAHATGLSATGPDITQPATTPLPARARSGAASSVDPDVAEGAGSVAAHATGLSATGPDITQPATAPLPARARAGAASSVDPDVAEVAGSVAARTAGSVAAHATAPSGPAPARPTGSTPARPAQHHATRAARYAGIAAHHDRHAAVHAARRNARSLIRPEHPTRLGDRLHAPAVRLGAEYGIDLATVWPRLWLLLPTSTRDTLTETRTRLDAAFALGGWALLYLPLALCWWPAALIAVVTAAVARRRAALAAEAYAELVEATVDLHLARLHSRLAEPRPSPQQGRALTERLRRGL
ncbi:hypothetical protein ACWD3I_33400 [Streptomyces sp. NPDC002817]|uniref:hypothetical protein n=1 Tax=Streptomyces sp. NPDC088357 TaxID=3154655 RepID=UPI003428F06D